MQIAPLPEDEAARLAELHRYEILDAAPEEALDDLTQPIKEKPLLVVVARCLATPSSEVAA